MIPRRWYGKDVATAKADEEGLTMIELPEAIVIARQITETLGGKRIASAVANASPHKFAWYTGNRQSTTSVLPER